MADRNQLLRRLRSRKGDSGVTVALVGVLAIAIVIGIGAWFIQFNA